MAPAAQLQPEQRSLRYENIRSALAEEGVVRLALLEPELLAQAGGLTGAEFSAPLLGKVYDLIRARHDQGRPVQLASLAGELTAEEMSHLARVTDRPEDLSQGAKTMADYVSVIRMEHLKTQGNADEALLRLAQEKYRETKAYGGS